MNHYFFGGLSSNIPTNDLNKNIYSFVVSMIFLSDFELVGLRNTFILFKLINFSLESLTLI